MNPPFSIGQKVVCIDAYGQFVKDSIYTVFDVFQCPKCGIWHLCVDELKHNGVSGQYNCTYSTGCNEPIKVVTNRGMRAKNFAPVETNYSDAKAEILEKFKSPNETPDKIIVPEKITT